MTRGKSLPEPDSHEVLSAPAPTADAGPFGWLPRLSHRQVGLERRLERLARGGGLPPALDWLQKEIGARIVIDRPEIHWRSSGLGRAGLVAQMTVSRLATRLALGIETPLAHVVVDRLLGFDRSFAESRLQPTPVEWGVWTFLVLRALDSFSGDDGPGSQDVADGGRHVTLAELTLDRVGPDPFDVTGLGSIVTVRWPVRIGTVAAAVRLWFPESLVSSWTAARARRVSPDTGPAAPQEPDAPAAELSQRVPRGQLISSWRAEAGLVIMSQGLKRLRIGGVLPMASSRLTGSPASPDGPVDLIVDLDGEDALFRIPTRPVADSGGRLLRLEAAPLREPRPRDPIAVSKSESKSMSQPNTSSGASSAPPAANPLDVPVTLTVELGRVNLTVTQLADLKPGDVVELNRHSRAPVELTSNGRLVARGELIMIDTDLGIRVTNVFL